VKYFNIGRCDACACAPAAAKSVCHATSSRGIHHFEMPATAITEIKTIKIKTIGRIAPPLGFR
jgi:hypothetical protein